LRDRPDRPKAAIRLARLTPEKIVNMEYKGHRKGYKTREDARPVCGSITPAGTTETLDARE